MAAKDGNSSGRDAHSKGSEEGLEMVQWLRAFVVLAEDSRLITSTHMVVHNYLTLASGI